MVLWSHFRVLFAARKQNLSGDSSNYQN